MLMANIISIFQYNGNIFLNSFFNKRKDEMIFNLYIFRKNNLFKN